MGWLWLIFIGTVLIWTLTTTAFWIATAKIILAVIGAIFFLAICFLIAQAVGAPAAERKAAAAAEAERKAAEVAAEAERKAAEEARIKRHKEQQDGYQKQLIVFGDNAILCFEGMPQHLKIAEKYLNQAELEFSENAFAPFWDVIEKAVVILGDFDDEVQKIKNISSEYKDLAEKYEDVPPQFPVSQKSVEKLSVGSLTAKRMQEIVRTAQCDFHFASIYEQRRTNQILVAGFTSLAQALDNMTCKITESINDLTDSVNSMARGLEKSTYAIHSRLGDIEYANTQRHAEIVELEAERAEREETVQEMLDNIQHRRKPD